MKYLEILIWIGTIFGAASNVGIHFFNDILGVASVFSGALGYVLFKNGEGNKVNNFEAVRNLFWLIGFANWFNCNRVQRFRYLG